LEVEQEESGQFGSRLYRRDPFVVDDHFVEEQPCKAIALFGPRRCPCSCHIRQ